MYPGAIGQQKPDWGVVNMNIRIGMTWLGDWQILLGNEIE